MGLIEYYLIACLATSLASLWFSFAPLVLLAKRLGVVNPITRSPKLSMLVYFCISCIAAPVILVTMASPVLGTAFHAGMTSVIMEEQ